MQARPRVEFFDEAAARLRRTVRFDGACWHTLDPGSNLITQHRLQDLPDRFPVLAHDEYAVQDVNKFDQLARGKRKAATMAQATGGHPERSPRFRDLLTPAGLGPQLRSAFVADGSTWGSLIVVRRAGSPSSPSATSPSLTARPRCSHAPSGAGSSRRRASPPPRHRTLRA